jgi:hypothetical protein
MAGGFTIVWSYSWGSGCDSRIWTGTVLLQILRQNLPKSVQRWIPYMKECVKVVEHWEWAQGLHQLGSNQLYVNRGLGSYPPGRLFCPPEVTVAPQLIQEVSAKASQLAGLAYNPDQMVLLPPSLVLQIQRESPYRELSHF